MADKIEANVVRGKGYWVKILGKPVPNYSKDGFEWVLDLSLDAEALKVLRDQGLGPKIKNKGDERGDFIQFKRKSVKTSGEKKGQDNQPIRVIAADGKTEWDRSQLIGNGSVLNVKYVLNETVDVKTKKKGMRADILAVQVYEHKPYNAPERQEFDANPEASPAEPKDW